MKNLTLAAVVWTLVLAIPFTLAALIGVAYLTEHAREIASLTQTFNQLTTVGGRGWLVELAERLPELAGMLIGQLVLLTVLLFSRKIEKEQGV